MLNTDMVRLIIYIHLNKRFGVWSRLALVLGAILLSTFITPLPLWAQSSLAPHVLVVANKNSANSMALANYYMTKRGVPRKNLCLLNWTADDKADSIPVARYQPEIATPIYNKIKTLPQRIDYVVLCRNLPVKIYFETNINNQNRAYSDMSVSSALAGKSLTTRINPYAYMSQNGTPQPIQPFNSNTYGMYLVTILDGHCWADAFSLVDNALESAPGGTFFFNSGDSWLADPRNGYSQENDLIASAYNLLVSMRVPAQLVTNGFVAPPQFLAGYVSWGSDDSRFRLATYRKLKFAKGSIVQTFTSTSCINVRYPQPGYPNGGWVWNQSQMATLIPQGATCLKGYVAEPYGEAMSNPNVYLPDYVNGWNMAQSFYHGSLMISWKDCVIGDPLCQYRPH